MHHTATNHSAADLAFAGPEPLDITIDTEENEVLRELIAKELADASRLLVELVNGPFGAIKEGGISHTETTLANHINLLSSLHARLLA